MKKKLTLICAALLCKSVFAVGATGTTVSVPELSHGAPNQTGWISTNHAYAIRNDSKVEQVGTVCMTTTLCYDGAAQYHKIIQSCEKFDLKPGDFKHNVNNTNLAYNYPFSGYCEVRATTEVFGWQHSLATGVGKLKVWPI